MLNGRRHIRSVPSTAIARSWPSPAQQALIVNEPAAAQDTEHEAYAAIRDGSRDFFVFDGELYRIGPEPEAGSTRKWGQGFGGRRWTVVWPDHERVTHNLWHWGTTAHADTATLIQEPFWTSLPQCDETTEY